MMKKQGSNRTDSGQFARGTSGNPLGRPPKASDPTAGSVPPGMNLDGWKNMLTGLGDAMFDKRLASQPVVEAVSDEEAQAIYRGDDMGAKAVDIWPSHMLREGFELCIKDLAPAKNEQDAEPEDPKLNKPTRQDARRRRRLDAKLEKQAEKTKKLATSAMKKFRKLKGKERFKEALAYARAYGGGAILLGVKDGSNDWKKPLVVDKARDLLFLTSLEPRELTPVSWYDDPLAENYGEPSIYQIVTTAPGTNQEDPTPQKVRYVHASRLIIFQGIKVSRNQASLRAGWGDSIFTRVKPVLRDFNMSWSSAAIIMHEFSIAWMKIKGLAEMVSTDAQKKLMARMAAVRLGQSIAKLTLLDMEEEMGRDTASVAGLADMLEKFMERLAAALEVPVELLMGMAPAGLNATGDAAIRHFFDRVKAAQIDDLEPELHRVFEIILRTLNGGKEPAEWSIEFKPLWQESPKEKAETRSIHANTDEKNILNGIYTADEVRRSRYGGDKYSDEITIDQDHVALPNPNETDLEAYKQTANGNAPVPADPNAPKLEESKLGPDGKPVQPKPEDDGKTIQIENPEPKKPADPLKPGEQPEAPAPTPAPPIPVNMGAGTMPDGKAIDPAKVLEVITAVTAKDISYSSGIATLMFCFKATPEQAKALLGPDTFEAPKPPAPVLPGMAKPGDKPGENPPDGDKPEPPKPGAPEPPKPEEEPAK